MRSMLSDAERDALDAIRLNIDAIRDFIEGLTAESFEGDRLRLYATTRALEIISEACRRLPEDFRIKYPSVDWRAIRDAGNVYRHSYARVLGARIWDTARHHLDELSEIVSIELRDDRPVDGPLEDQP